MDHHSQIFKYLVDIQNVSLQLPNRRFPLEITAAMRTGLSPVRVLSIRACKLLPVPESSTTTSQVAGISAP